MERTCSIVQDLLPLYAEHMVRDDTAAFVAGHLQDCEACRKEYEQIREPKPIRMVNDREAVPLQTLSRKLKMKRMQTVALTAVLAVALLVSAFAVLGAPIYQPYSDGVVTVAQCGEQGVILTFDAGITDFRCDVHADPDNGDMRICDIEAWTTLWDRWFSKGKEKLSTTVRSEGKPMYLFYVPNDTGENVCLAKYDPYAENQLELDGQTKGVTTMPRLVLGYYLILAAAASGLAAVVWFCTRRKRPVRLWVERIGLYPVAYIVSHFIVSGIPWTSYSAERDFSLILFLSVVLYGGLLLAHNIGYLRKEIRAVKQ